MEIEDTPHQRETDAGAGAILLAAAPPPEATENQILVRIDDSGTAILDGDLAASGDRDRNGGPLRRGVQGVLNDIADGDAEEVCIARRRHRRRGLIEFDQLSLRRRDHRQLLACGPTDFAEIMHHEVRARQLLGLREAEQLRHQAAHRGHIALEPDDRVALGQARNGEQKHRERGSQFMGGVGGELSLLIEQAIDFLQHGVHRADQIHGLPRQARIGQRRQSPAFRYALPERPRLFGDGGQRTQSRPDNQEHGQGEAWNEDEHRHGDVLQDLFYEHFAPKPGRIAAQGNLDPQRRAANLFPQDYEPPVVVWPRRAIARENEVRAPAAKARDERKQLLIGHRDDVVLGIEDPITVSFRILGVMRRCDVLNAAWRRASVNPWPSRSSVARRKVVKSTEYSAVTSTMRARAKLAATAVRRSAMTIVSSSAHGLDSYIRCQADHPGVLWLSLFWLHSAADLHMDRAVTLISGSLASAMSGAPFAEVPQLASRATPDMTAAAPLPDPDSTAPTEQREKGEPSGMGVFVNAGGDVVTNAHVVENCASIAVAKDQIATAGASLVARDAANDLAVLKTTLKPERVASIRSGIRLGEAVAAHGFSPAPSSSHSGDLADGEVTALVGMGGDTRYMQTSTPVAPGDSGTPLFDQSGNVVGLVSAKFRAPNIKVATAGDIPADVNFATKGSLVASFLESNRIAFTDATASHEISEPDLAEQARAVSVSVSCR
jgi:serine protease Do